MVRNHNCFQDEILFPKFLFTLSDRQKGMQLVLELVAYTCNNSYYMSLTKNSPFQTQHLRKFIKKPERRNYAVSAHPFLFPVWLNLVPGLQ